MHSQYTSLNLAWPRPLDVVAKTRYWSGRTIYSYLSICRFVLHLHMCQTIYVHVLMDWILSLNTNSNLSDYFTKEILSKSHNHLTKTKTPLKYKYIKAFFTWHCLNNTFNLQGFVTCYTCFILSHFLIQK